MNENGVWAWYGTQALEWNKNENENGASVEILASVQIHASFQILAFVEILASVDPFKMDPASAQLV